MKKLLSMLLALVVLMGVWAVPALAGTVTPAPTPVPENRYEGDEHDGTLADTIGGTMTFDKYLVLKKDATVPNVQFKFVIKAGDGGDGEGEQVFIKPVDKNDVTPSSARDSSLYTVIGKPVFTTGTDITLTETVYANDSAILTYKPGDTNTTIAEADAPAAPNYKTIDFMTTTKTDDEKYAQKTLTLNFANVTFLEPGVYRYTITESEYVPAGGSSLPGLVLDPDAAVSKERYLDVYVVDDPTNVGNLEVASYVLHETATAPGIDNTERGTKESSYKGGGADDKTDGDTANNTYELLDKSTGFSNQWDTCDLEFKKEVTGNQGSRDKYFKFTVTVTSDPVLTDSLLFEVDMTNATLAPSENVATDYSASDMLAANSTSLDSTTVSGKRLVKGGDLNTGKVFYLQHGQSIRIKGLPAGATYTVVEVTEEYKSTGAAVTNYKNETTGVLKTIDAKNRQTNADEARDDVVYTSFQNSRQGIVPTGILTVIGPAVAVIALAVVGLAIVLVGKRRESAR